MRTTGPSSVMAMVCSLDGDLARVLGLALDELALGELALGDDLVFESRPAAVSSRASWP